eukprot:125223_1
MRSLFLYYVMLIICQSQAISNEYHCDIFSNYFTIYNQQFIDVCGNLSMFRMSDNYSNPKYLDTSYLKDRINSNDNTFVIGDGEYIKLDTSVIFTTDRWCIIFEGYSMKKTYLKQEAFNIILGPSSVPGGNCQIRFEYRNTNNYLCIYSYYYANYSKYLNYDTIEYGECVLLRDDIYELHTLILYYNNGILNIYQNRQFVTSINNQFQISLARIGGWYNNQYPASITIKNIMFTNNVNYDDIYQYLYPYGRRLIDLNNYLQKENQNEEI